jgi:hypothetical protein
MAASVHLVPSSPLNQSIQKPWPAVTGAEEEELAATALVEKFRQLAGLVALAPHLGWPEARAAEENEVRPHWAQVRRGLHAWIAKLVTLAGGVERP